MARPRRGRPHTLDWAQIAADSRPTMSTQARSGEGWPLDINGFVRQCAWCRRIADAQGHYRLVVEAMIPGASHGCCEACAIRFLSRNQAGQPMAGRDRPVSSGGRA